MKEASSDAEKLKELWEGEDYLFRFDIGIYQPCTAINAESIDNILQLFANHYLISSVKAELDQFLDGLRVLDVIDLIRSNPNKMKQLLVYSEPEVITTENMMLLFPPKHSPDGSNRREVEEKIGILWIHFLQSIECTYVPTVQL